MNEATDHGSNGKLPDYYGTLGVSETASFGEIKTAYWKLAFSPDRGGDLPQLNEAYEVLGSEERREAYDAQRNMDSVWMKELDHDRPSGDFQDPRARPWR